MSTILTLLIVLTVVIAGFILVYFREDCRPSFIELFRSRFAGKPSGTGNFTGFADGRDSDSTVPDEAETIPENSVAAGHTVSVSISPVSGNGTSVCKDLFIPEGKKTTIGRGEGCNFRIPNEYGKVGRVQGVLIYKNNSLYLRDCGKTNRIVSEDGTQLTDAVRILEPTCFFVGGCRIIVDPKLRAKEYKRPCADTGTTPPTIEYTPRRKTAPYDYRTDFDFDGV